MFELATEGIQFWLSGVAGGHRAGLDVLGAEELYQSEDLYSTPDGQRTLGRSPIDNLDITGDITGVRIGPTYVPQFNAGQPENP